MGDVKDSNRVKRAKKLYEEFTGHVADDVVFVEVKDYDTIVGVGYVDAISYETIRDGKKEKYIHTFKKKSRPLLAVSHDGRQAYMLGGAFTFTELGFVDDGTKIEE